MFPIWGYWAEEWEYREKVTFNGNTRKIYIFPEVATLKVKDDIYSAWVRWVEINENYRYLPAFRYIGGDPIGGGQYSGEMFFLQNGWQIVADHNVLVDGIIYHDDGIPVYDILQGGGVTNRVASLAYAYSSEIPEVTVDTQAIATAVVNAIPEYPEPIVPPTAEEIAAVIIPLLPEGVTPEQLAQAVWNYTQ